MVGCFLILPSNWDLGYFWIVLLTSVGSCGKAWGTSNSTSLSSFFLRVAVANIRVWFSRDLLSLFFPTATFWLGHLSDSWTQINKLTCPRENCFLIVAIHHCKLQQLLCRIQRAWCRFSFDILRHRKDPKKNVLQWRVTRSNSPKCCQNISKLESGERTYRIWRIASWLMPGSNLNFCMFSRTERIPKSRGWKDDEILGTTLGFNGNAWNPPSFTHVRSGNILVAGKTMRHENYPKFWECMLRLLSHHKFRCTSSSSLAIYYSTITV